MADELITVAYFPDEIEAQLARGFLKNSGIKAFIVYDAGGKHDPYGFSPIYRHKWISLKVHPLDASHAIKLLRPKWPKSLKASDDFSKNLNVKLSFFARVLMVVGVIFLLAGPEQQIWFFSGIAFLMVGVSLKVFLRYLKGNYRERKKQRIST